MSDAESPSRPEGRLNALTETVIGLAFKVSNALGAGFLEKAYQHALVHELRKAGLQVEHQKPIVIHYDGIVAGEYVADIVVNECLLVETKAIKALDASHVAQCINYIAATGLPACLLLNFAARVEVKRFIDSKRLNTSVPHLRPSASSAATSSIPAPVVPMTYAEQAEWDDR